VYADFCNGQPIQLFFYTALIYKDLLASAGQVMPLEASSSSSTPGSTVNIGFRGATKTALLLRRSSSSGPSKITIATEAAKAAAAVLLPKESPGTKQLEKRKLEAEADFVESQAKKAKMEADFAESQAKKAKMDELVMLEARIQLKKAHLEATNDDTPSKSAARRMVSVMLKRAADLESQIFGYLEPGPSAAMNTRLGALAEAAGMNQMDYEEEDE
jgi:hypothetical protein